MENSTRNCPICNGDQPHFVHLQAFANSASHEIVRCLQCGSYYNCPIIDSLLVDYSKSTKYLEDSTFGAESVLNASNTKKQYNFFSDSLNHDSEILEIGFGPGSLLKLLVSNGYKNLSGVEPGEPARIALIDALDDTAITLFSNLDNANNVYDCVIVSHVLEHVDTPAEFLESISTKIAPGGFLFLEVPDASRYFDFRITPFHFFDQEHLSHFTVSSLASLLDGKFEIQKIQQDVVQVSITAEYPVIRLLCRMKDFDFIENYVEWSKLGVRNELPSSFDVKESFFVYGWGSYAKAFLVRNDIPSFPGFKGVIDSFVTERRIDNLNIQGGRVEIDVFNPSVLEDFSDTKVLILSALFHKDIAFFLRDNFPDVQIFLPNSSSPG